MPEIIRFFDIIIRMFIEAGVVHHTPHFHAYYQEHVGLFSLDPVELIAGDPGRRKRPNVCASAMRAIFLSVPNVASMTRRRPSVSGGVARTQTISS